MCFYAIYICCLEIFSLSVWNFTSVNSESEYIKSHFSDPKSGSEM